MSNTVYKSKKHSVAQVEFLNYADQSLNLNMPKYSIIIPTYNGISYLPTCIETIISQNYDSYELIISDDNSVDGTRDYLEKLSHPNIKVIYPPESLSMTEHWEWALSHAIGKWQIFVGQDDGLQPYFFQLADKLTNIAKEKGLRTITSSRAYFFWEGCSYVYGDIAVAYVAENKIRVCNFRYQILKTILGFQNYFELPQMYTTALFHKELLDEARVKQSGKVFSSHPQDANLAALACSLEKEYLKSYIPLGWVGSSPKSAGMAIFSDIEKADESNTKKLSELRDEYKKKVNKSKIKYHELAGDFSFGNLSIYFWQALLTTSSLRTIWTKTLLTSKLFRIMLFSTIRNEDKKEANLSKFKHLIKTNNISLWTVSITAYFFNLIRFSWYVVQLLWRAIRKLSFKVSYSKYWDKDIEISMLKASSEINDKLKTQNWM